MSAVASYLGDPAFPQLALAVDAPHMARHFERLLAAPTQWGVTACRLERLRYRGGTRCILYYEITLHRTSDGAEQLSWITGYLYADNAKLQSRLRRLDAGGAAHDANAPLPHYALLAELDMLITCFPTDHGLPGLRVFAANPSAVFAPHCTALFGADGWRLLDVALKPVRWRAGLSAVMRAHVHGAHRDGGVAEQMYYVKVCRPGSAGVVCEESRPLPFKVADTVLHDAARGITIQRAAAGVTLLDLLTQRRAGRHEAARLAEVLARWHLSGAPLNRCFPHTERHAALERLAQTLAAAVPYLCDTVSAVVADIRRHWIAGVLVPAHLDLKPDHIFFAADGLTLIDLDSAADADPAQELARLLARLRHAQALYQVPAGHARRFAAELYLGYRAEVPQRWLDNLPCCYAWSLLQIAGSMFEHQRPGWAGWVYRLVHEAATIDLASPDGCAHLLETAEDPPAAPPTDHAGMESRP